VPLQAGGAKQWGTPDDSFWCCYGTGIESFAKLGDSIYFHDDSGLYVNLFIASTVTWKAKGLRLEQITKFPEQEGSSFVFRLDRPTRLTLHLHIPDWATTGVSVKVNGTEAPQKARPTSYLALTREWKDGDRVDLSLPMSLHACPMPDDPEMVAVMYGPVVLAGISPDPDAVFLSDPRDPTRWIAKTNDGPLTFATQGQKTTMRLAPWYQVVDEPYGIYWIVTPEGSARHKAILAAEEARREREARLVDHVIVGDEASERAHNLQGEKTAAGPYSNRHWRHAPDGGWFSWELKVLPDAPMTLTCTYWGSDVPPRKFDVVVEGKVIGTQELNVNKPGHFFDVEYAIPAELTKGKEKVTVRFQGYPGNTAGGVFDCGILKPQG